MSGKLKHMFVGLALSAIASSPDVEMVTHGDCVSADDVVGAYKEAGWRPVAYAQSFSGNAPHYIFSDPVTNKWNLLVGLPWGGKVDTVCLAREGTAMKTYSGTSFVEEISYKHVPYNDGANAWLGWYLSQPTYRKGNYPSKNYCDDKTRVEGSLSASFNQNKVFSGIDKNGQDFILTANDNGYWAVVEPDPEDTSQYCVQKGGEHFSFMSGYPKVQYNF